jgi:hypothetical protein
MHRVLVERGYQNVRVNYPIAGFPDLDPGMDDVAALVAFDGDDPIVLGYPVDEGDVDNPWLQEAAKFQAGIVTSGKAARLVWVCDGISSYVFDIARDRLLPSLPSYEELQTQRESTTPGSSSPSGGVPTSSF